MNRATFVTGFGGGALAALLLAPATGTALGELARARGARAETQAVAAAPVRAPAALVVPELRVPAASEATAARVLAGRVRAMAAQGGVLVEQTTPVRGGGGLVRLSLRLSGPSKAVIALVDRLEREAPLMRLLSWEVTALADGGLRVSGEALGAWR